MAFRFRAATLGYTESRLDEIPNETIAKRKQLVGISISLLAEGKVEQ